MSIILDCNITSNKITPLNNHLLSALSTVEYERLFPCLELINLALDDVIYESGDKLLYVYFPLMRLSLYPTQWNPVHPQKYR
jgi:hypothetical protein